jgi:hypothetical protein
VLWYYPFERFTNPLVVALSVKVPPSPLGVFVNIGEPLSANREGLDDGAVRFAIFQSFECVYEFEVTVLTAVGFDHEL